MMKHQSLFFFLLAALVLISLQAFTRAIRLDEAEKAVLQKIAMSGKGGEYTIHGIKSFTNPAGGMLWYLVAIEPEGFMVVSADTGLPPILYYTFTGACPGDDAYAQQFISFISYDIAGRVDVLDNLPPSVVSERNRQWEDLLGGVAARDGRLFQQWPPEGTTPTGGWLWDNWTQSAPYNNFCPIDPVTNQRSVAGCPATAMAMVLNFYKTSNDTHFDDSDDYHHNYAGRNFWIDDDYLEHGFISFPQMNDYLDTLNKHWGGGEGLTDDDKAALTFACGVAAKQVYTSSGSGTFGVDQAYNAYLRFGFTDAELMDETDTSLYTQLSSNMKNAMPAHLAVVTPAWDMGHNVVVDGYNTDDYYHINFGWGGPYNGWYLIPEEIPYGLTVIEGVIVNIWFNPGVGITGNEPAIILSDIFPNPAHDHINLAVTLDAPQVMVVRIMDMTGRLVSRFRIKGEQGSNRAKVDLSALPCPGLYLCEVNTFSGKVIKKLVVE
jgi:hypothetical protein